MIHRKTDEEIQIMKQGGRILAQTLHEVLDHIKPEVTELELDKLAEEFIRKHGAVPGFQKVKGYRHTICTSVNDVVVHGVPTKYKLKEGDVIGIDCGVFYKGLHTDMSETVRVKDKGLMINDKENKIDAFLETGKRALEEAIAVAIVGNRVGHISKVIQEIVEHAGYSVVRSLVGHGVGRKLHEEPEVPGYLSGSILETPLLKEGLTLAIEVIYNMGAPGVEYAGVDDWTIRTKDRSLSAVFERTVVITKKGALVLTA